eukprot:6360745-Amphidinium_carterae.1
MSRLHAITTIPATVFCLTETKKTRDEIPTLTTILRRKGLFSHWSPAVRFDNGYASAGVSIWSRAPMQDWTPEHPHLRQWNAQGRLLGAWT